MKQRLKHIKALSEQTYDVLILGGGINGAVSAASLAAKGLKVALIDKGDFAGVTSSNSSNLAWGGIKYLESHEYLLVNKLCKSRNHLMRSYPSSVKEVRFLTAIQKGFRFPPFFVFLGTIFYWLIGRFVTQAPAYLTPKAIKGREPVINTDNATGGFEYSDCYLYDNDARFTFNFIRAAMDYGCDAANYTESLSSKRVDGCWESEVRDNISGDTFAVKSKAIVNACGPYVDQYNEATQQDTLHRHLFSKGIHLIVDRIAKETRVLAFFASDGRLFFVIPMGSQTCIGTTDTQVENPETYVTEEDRQFVLDNANALLRLDRTLTKDDVISERCGVRPLALKGQDGVADWVKLSRKHAIDIDKDNQHLSIFGGKTTDCINVGDEVSDIIADLGIALPDANKIWYGEPGDDIKQAFLQKAASIGLDNMTAATTASEPLTERLWRRYAGEAIRIVEAIEKDPSGAEILIEHTEFIRAEVELVAEREMIVKLDDFLRRRAMVSLVVPREKLINAKGLKEACAILFGDEADAKLQEYIDATAS